MDWKSIQHIDLIKLHSAQLLISSSIHNPNQISNLKGIYIPLPFLSSPYKQFNKSIGPNTQQSNSFHFKSCSKCLTIHIHGSYSALGCIIFYWTLYNLSAEYVSNFSVGSVHEWRHLPREAGGLEKVTQDFRWRGEVGKKWRHLL